MTAAFSIFSFISISYSRAKASAERMEEVLLNEDLEMDEQTLTNQTLLNGDLQFKNVSFHYANESVPALTDVSFHVASGEKLVIMGATGSGKSTMLNLIPRLFEKTKGEILIGGKEIEEWSLKELRDKIGLVPQQSILFTGTILENLSWGKTNASIEELELAAKKAQIHNSIISFPKKYETRVGQKGVNLSGGQKQRLSIARALVRKPAILIFDDSTSALDVKTETALWDALAGEDATMLVVTQKISTAQGADKILLLDDGIVVGYGTHDDLLKESPLYAKIAQSQLEGLVDSDVTSNS